MSDEIAMAAYEFAESCATRASCRPARVMFVESPGAKDPPNRRSPQKRGHDDETAGGRHHRLWPGIFGNLPKLFARTAARAWFAGKDDLNLHAPFATERFGLWRFRKAACAQPGTRF
ncbi:MAG: hypothetical protein V3S88_03470 [Alphaproteobacteria bacterium]